MMYISRFEAIAIPQCNVLRPARSCVRVILDSILHDVCIGDCLKSLSSGEKLGRGTPPPIKMFAYTMIFL